MTVSSGITYTINITVDERYLSNIMQLDSIKKYLTLSTDPLGGVSVTVYYKR